MEFTYFHQVLLVSQDVWEPQFHAQFEAHSPKYSFNMVISKTAGVRPLISGEILLVDQYLHIAALPLSYP